LLAITLALTTAQGFTAEDVHEAARQARNQREVTCIFRAEIGGVHYNPYAPHSDPLNQGPGGLRTNGLMPQFYAWGYIDHYNPYEVADYIDRVIDQGRHSNWPYLRSYLNSGRC
jgi:hypothetical protein